jgi:hypothetical protein
MARGLGGFAEGFQGGFGLVNDFYAQKSRDKYQDEISKYRQDSLQVEREADVRKGIHEDRMFDEQVKETDFARETKRIAGETAADTKTWRESESLLSAEGRNEDKKLRLIERGILESKQGEINRQIGIAKRQELDLRNGRHFQNIMDMGADGNHAGMLDYINKNRDDLHNPESTVNILDHLNPDNNVFNASLLGQLKEIAGGALDNPDYETPPEALAAISNLINQDKKKHIGQTIGPEHVNAPESFHGMVITASGISNARTGRKEEDDDTGKKGDFELQFDAWVQAKDKDGDIHYYTAPVTENGDVATTRVQGVSLEAGSQALAAMVGLSAHMQENPLVRSAVEESIKIQRWGSLKEFETAMAEGVDKLLTQFGKLAKDVNTNDHEGLVYKGFAGMTIGELFANKVGLRAQLEHNAIYGPPKTGDQKRAEKYKDDIARDVPTFTYKDVPNQSNKMGRKRQEGNIGDLIEGGTEVLTDNQMLEINQLVDESGEFSGESLMKLRAYLHTQRILITKGRGYRPALNSEGNQDEKKQEKENSTTPHKMFN